MEVGNVCAIASVVLSLCTFVGGAIGFCIIKFNDMHHNELSLRKVEEKLDDIIKIQNLHGEAIVRIEERCKVRSEAEKTLRK